MKKHKDNIDQSFGYYLWRVGIKGNYVFANKSFNESIVDKEIKLITYYINVVGSRHWVLGGWV